MAVPNSGAVSMKGLAREKKYCNYSSTGAISGAISLIDLFNGGNSCGPSGENYDRSNDSQDCYPHPTWLLTPVSYANNKKMSQWQCSIPPAPIGYCHSLGGRWTTKSNLPACRYYPSGLGTYSNGVLVGGATSYATTTGNPFSNSGCQQTYEWNGSSWSTGGNFPSPGIHSGQGAGTGTSGAVFGGCCGSTIMTSKNYRYNGTSWSLSTHCNYISTDMLAKNRSTLSSGFNENGWGASTTIQAGGNGGSNKVKKWRNASGNSNCTLVSQLSNMNAGCREMYVAIGRNEYDYFLAGGYGLSQYPRRDTECWNGGSWSTQANMNYGRCSAMSNNTAYGWSFFNVWGGCANASTFIFDTSQQEAFNGTSWSTQTSMPVSWQKGAASFGKNCYVGVWDGDCSLSAGGNKYGITSGYATNSTYAIKQNNQRCYS